MCKTKNIIKRSGGLAAATLGLVVWTTSANAVPISVTIENLSPTNGLFLTPFWVGFHNGSFDLYDQGSPASPGLERLAEDGNTGPLSDEFAMNGSGSDATVLAPAGFTGAPIFDPGESVTEIFNLDPAEERYFSYASMVIPSNDAFIANGNPLAHEIFDGLGSFVGAFTFLILGADVLDAGTEVNSETSAAFLDQMNPNEGTTEGGVVSLHPGFNGSLGNPLGAPMNILGGTNAAGFPIGVVEGDFTQPDYQIARITISAIPEPSSFALFGLGIGLIALSGRRRSK